MLSLEVARERWKLTLAGVSSLSELGAAVTDGTKDSPCIVGLRSVSWKVKNHFAPEAFLLFQDLDQATWPKKLSDSRSAYSALRERFLHNVEHPKELESMGDPLTIDDESPWNILRQDEILREEILQDVERCMPDNFYFREPRTQTMLLDILFIFCKLNQDVGYRQGMHELLAPVLWVIERDALQRITSDESNLDANGDVLMDITLDSRFIEHDTFTIFNVIMRSAKSFYELGGQVSEATTAHSGRKTIPQNHSAIVTRSQRIHEDLLARVDPELANWLKEIEVLPQVFLIRWIRLLFGREFGFDDLLLLWDSLFAEDPALELVDMVCVAMLLRIRWQLLEADYSTALSLLLRYPQPSTPPSDFVTDALYLRKNLTPEGGHQIVFRHSRKRILEQKADVRSSVPVKPHGVFDPQSKSSSPSQRSNAKPRNANLRTSLPLPSPVRFLQERGGVEGIIKGAIGELKQNMQSLNGGSPPRQDVGVRQPIRPDIYSVSPNASQIAARIDFLEARNKSLARMLEDSLKGLWDHQKTVAENKTKLDVDALSLAIAKVQFVQVYLEDSTMPVPLHGEPSQPLNNPDNAEEHVPSSSPATSEATDARNATEVASESRDDSKPTDSNVNLRNERRSETNKPFPALGVSSVTTTQPSPFHQPRPSLAQSSFSWMLGEDQRRSSFVSASSLPPETRRRSHARGKAGYLFGDDKPPLAEDPSLSKAESSDLEGFTLGTLKGNRN